MLDENLLLPNHVAIIMDGNGRWAKNRGLPRTAGHKEGLSSAKKIVAKAAQLKIPFITLFTFSTENWKRAESEVGYLMSLIKKHLASEFEFYKKNGIKIEHIGDLCALPKEVQSEIFKAKDETKDFLGTTCTLAINYGGRDEILRAAKKLSQKNIDFLKLSESDFSYAMDFPTLPDVDLLIRTGGEFRISNFLLWKAAYAELMFSKTLWPDYCEAEFLENLEEFQKRTRRFGGIPQ